MTLEQAQCLKEQLRKMTADIKEMKVKWQGIRVNVKPKTSALGKIKIGNLMHGAIASIKPKKKRNPMDDFKTRLESASALIEEAGHLGEPAPEQQPPQEQPKEE